MGDMNLDLEDSFPSEVMRWRYFKALSLSFLLQLMVSTVLCNTINTVCFEVTWNPFTWMYYFLYGIIKPYWLLRILLPLGCYIILTRIHVHSYSVSWWVPGQRLQYFTKLFQVRSLIYSIALICVSPCLLQYYAFLVHPDFATLSTPCINSDKSCINHQALLILLFGLAFGFRLSCKYFLQNYGSIQFPVTQPSPLMRLKSKLQLRIIIESCALFDIGVGFLATVFAAYFLLGGTISHWISSFVGVFSDESYQVWNILAMLLDLRFILTLVLCLILLAYNLHCFFLIFEETIAQRVELPLQMNEDPFYTSENQPPGHSRTLSNALASSCDILRLLAFRHFRDISLDRTARGLFYKTQIFAISQPGGHPRNWQGVVNPSLNLIRKFCEKLKRNNCLEEKPVSLQPTIPPSALLQTDVNRNQLVKESRFSLRQKWQQVKESLKQFPFFCYLLSELPDSKNRETFAEAQAVIWAVEGLSNLVATSYSSDKFGVVQKNISDIFTTLIQLQLVIEKVGRGLPYRRVTQGTNFGRKIQKYPHDLQLRRSLRLTLRSSLYIMTNTFKESIREVPLSEDVQTKLESYLTFQEG